MRMVLEGQPDCVVESVHLSWPLLFSSFDLETPHLFGEEVEVRRQERVFVEIGLSCRPLRYQRVVGTRRIGGRPPRNVDKSKPFYWNQIGTSRLECWNGWQTEDKPLVAVQDRGAVTICCFIRFWSPKNTMYWFIWGISGYLNNHFKPHWLFGCHHLRGTCLDGQSIQFYSRDSWFGICFSSVDCWKGWKLPVVCHFHLHKAETTFLNSKGKRGTLWIMCQSNSAVGHN